MTPLLLLITALTLYAAHRLTRPLPRSHDAPVMLCQDPRQVVHMFHSAAQHAERKPLRDWMQKPNCRAPQS